MAPTDEGVRRELRLAVHRLRAGQRRRVFCPVVHIGRLDAGPAGRDGGVGAATWTDDRRRPLDPGLRGEIAAALLSRALAETARPAAWLTRTGVPQTHDVDLAWLGPVTRAFAEAGVAPRCLAVVTKTGWYAPLTGERATWQRLRIRTRG